MQPQQPMPPYGMSPQGQQPMGQQPFQPQSASTMKKHFNFLIIPLVLVSLFFVASLAFAIWAYGERNTYKNKTDSIVAREVELARQQTATEKDKEFTEKEKNPYKTYKGPSTFASINLQYPKTWSAFITEKDSGSKLIEGYLHPDFVPGIDSDTSFALHVQVVERAYDAEMKSLESKVRTGKVRVSPFRAAKVPDVLGAKVEGEVNDGQKNIMVLFPVRDKTLKIITQSEQFHNDFNTIILPNLIFVP